MGAALPWLFLLPAGLLTIVFRILPIVAAFGLSFFDASFGKIHAFVGAGQYVRLLSDPDFWQSVANTMWFVIGAVPLSIAVSLLFAVLLKRGVRALGVYRTIYFLPVVTSFVAVSMMWKLIFHPRFGAANALLGALGGSGLQWLEEPRGIFALAGAACGLHLPAWAHGPSLALVCVTFVSAWRGIGYNVVIFLAGLQNIPEHHYEAARIDGAGRFAIFRHVTWPLLGPTTFYVGVMTTILSFQVFAPIYLMTGPPVGAARHHERHRLLPLPEGLRRRRQHGLRVGGGAGPVRRDPRADALPAEGRGGARSLCVGSRRSAARGPRICC